MDEETSKKGIWIMKFTFIFMVLTIFSPFVLVAIMSQNKTDTTNFIEGKEIDCVSYNKIDYNKLLYAIAMVESSNGKNVYGDYSRNYTENDIKRFVETKDVKAFINARAPGSNSPALGKYQIQNLYWQDGCESLRVEWEHWDALNDDKARQVVIAYLNRYGNKDRIGREPTYKDLALIHHLGPRGYREDHRPQAREAYWKKIKKYLK